MNNNENISPEENQEPGHSLEGNKGEEREGFNQPQKSVNFSDTGEQILELDSEDLMNPEEKEIVQEIDQLKSQLESLQKWVNIESHPEDQIKIEEIQRNIIGKLVFKLDPTTLIIRERIDQDPQLTQLYLKAKKEVFENPKYSDKIENIDGRKRAPRKVILGAFSDLLITEFDKNPDIIEKLKIF